MAAASATLPSSIQTLFGVLWGAIWVAGMIVLFVRYASAARAFYRLFDWLKENWITGVETPPWDMRRTMFNLLFQPQPGDAELEQFRQRALRRLVLVPIWLFGWVTALIAGTVFLAATGLTR